MKKNKKLVVVLSVILVILIGIAAVLFVNRNSDKKEDKTEEEAVSTIEQQIQSEEACEIETKYTTLYFPKKWEDNLETEIVEGDDYRVVFYGKLDGKDNQELFTIVFNGDASLMLGVLEQEENTYVGLEYAEPEMGDGWTEEETDVIYAMQEDVNYLIGMLVKTEGFVSEY